MEIKTEKFYRPDIDGLRALAIISVVIYHAFPELLSGGFVGVDVFFAISGYLISGILFRQLSAGTFSFADFYARRIRRIFPALLLVFLVVFLTGWFGLLAAEFKQLGKHMAAGAGFVENLALWREAGYFDTASELKPLMHLWSLAIEEQYYLLYPLLIVALWRLGWNLLLIIIVLIVGSFFWNIHQVYIDPVATFFLPQTRIWELLAGGVLAYLHNDFHKYTKSTIPALLSRTLTVLSGKEIFSNALAFIGITLVILPMFFVNKLFAFPGWWALLPLMGALTLIQAGSVTWINRRLLSNRLMVGIGLISYPLYLWHWPVLTFARIFLLETPSVAMRITLLFACVILAVLTYVCLEKPLRSQSVTAGKIFLLLGLMVVTFFAGYITYLQNGFPSRGEERERFDLYFENAAPSFNYVKTHGLYELYRMDCDFWDWSHDGSLKDALTPSCYTPHSGQVLFLWGDSHVQHLNPGLTAVMPVNVSILQVATSACAPAIVSPNTVFDSSHICEKSNQLAMQKIRITKPRDVIIAQLGDHDKTDYESMARTLKSFGVERVLVMGPVPRWKPELYKIISRRAWHSTAHRLNSNFDREIFKLDKKMKKRYANNSEVEYISIVDYLCNSEGCLTLLGDNRRDDLITWDYAHFTPKASEYVARGLLLPKIYKDYSL